MVLGLCLLVILNLLFAITCKSWFFIFLFLEVLFSHVLGNNIHGHAHLSQSKTDAACLNLFGDQILTTKSVSLSMSRSPKEGIILWVFWKCLIILPVTLLSKWLKVDIIIQQRF